jgi:hypothetical protein
MTEMGHEDQFTPPRPNAGYRIRKETVAGTRRTGRDAPLADFGDAAARPALRRLPHRIASPEIDADTRDRATA